MIPVWTPPSELTPWLEENREAIAASWRRYEAEMARLSEGWCRWPDHGRLGRHRGHEGYCARCYGWYVAGRDTGWSCRSETGMRMLGLL